MAGTTFAAKPIWVRVTCTQLAVLKKATRLGVYSRSDCSAMRKSKPPRKKGGCESVSRLIDVVVDSTLKLSTKIATRVAVRSRHTTSSGRIAPWHRQLSQRHSLGRPSCPESLGAVGSECLQHEQRSVAVEGADSHTNVPMQRIGQSTMPAIRTAIWADFSMMNKS